MKRFYLLCILSALLICGCTNDADTPTIKSEKSTEIIDRFYSIEEICDIAINAYKDFGFSCTSRNDIRAYAKPYYPTGMSRNISLDTLFYSVNFEGGGFALILADKYANINTIAISETGTFEDNDNSYLQDYAFRMLPDSLLKKPFPPKTITPEPGPTDPYIWDENGERTEVTSEVFEYNNYTLTAWDQGYPYNCHCDFLSESDYNRVKAEGKDSYYQGHGLTGCAPIAISQICAYYGLPTQYRGRTLDWDYVTKDSRIHYQNVINDNILFFISSIGKDMGVTHGYSTSTSFDKIPSLLHSLGFKSAKKTSDINECFEALKKGEVVYMRGDDAKSSVGHGWVVDAYKDIKYTYTKYWKGSSNSRVFKTTHRHFLAFNWGWGKRDDHVYYLAEDPYHTGYYDTSNDEIVFNKNFRYIVNIR